jgi:hypothetical protein
VIGIRNFGLAVWLLASTGAWITACGDDANDTETPGGNDSGTRTRNDGGPRGTTRDAATGSGDRTDGGSTSQSDASTSGPNPNPNSGGDEDGGGGGEPCGAVICEAPECCADPFVSRCGAQLGRACLMPPPASPGADPRCPSISIMGIFTLASCCTDDNQCGIDASTFGTGCISYEQAEMGARNMGAGGFIPWPAAQSCN